MSERPELPPARRRRTAMMICTYLDVKKPSQKQLDTLADVLLAGELDFAMACHRQGQMSQSQTGFRGWWEALAVGLQKKLDSLAYLKDAFCVHSDVSEANLTEVLNDVQATEEND